MGGTHVGSKFWLLFGLSWRLEKELTPHLFYVHWHGIFDSFLSDDCPQPHRKVSAVDSVYRSCHCGQLRMVLSLLVNLKKWAFRRCVPPDGCDITGSGQQGYLKCYWEKSKLNKQILLEVDLEMKEKVFVRQFRKFEKSVFLQVVCGGDN